MADHFVGINRGGGDHGYVFTDSTFTYGTSTGATDIELRIADGAGWTKQEVLVAIELLELFITTSNPAITGTEGFPVGAG
jgi:hypothetical protein